MTQTEDVLTRGVDLLKPWAEEMTLTKDGRWDAIVRPDNLLAAVDVLHKNRWGYLTSITGMDLGVEAGELEIIYHFRQDAAIIGLRVRTPRDNASVHSICGIVPSVSLMEHEMAEMFGVNVVDMPPSGRLFLAEDWPDSAHPLLKDFDPEKVEPRDLSDSELDDVAEEFPSAQDNPERFIVPIGPQHPALKEPGHFEFNVDGEVVTSASARLGYAHRGIEKATESRTWVQNLYLLERVCGICSHIHALTYCQGVEKLAGVEVSPRARAIRTLVAELERLHSHMLWLGVGAHEAGFDTLFMYSWRDREVVMDLLEGLSGNRVNYSANLLGGVKFDVTDAQIQAILDGAKILEQRLHHYLDVATTDESFLMRTRGIGTMTQEQAELLGTVGPTARASGVTRDLRIDAPYAYYPESPVKAVITSEGDLLARVVVRIEELFESLRMVCDLAQNLPEGDLTVRVPTRIKEGETVSCCEAPRGELYYFIRSNGTDKPERIKVRTPTLSNWGAVLSTVVGHQLADVPMILAGVDPCFSCNDRMVSLYTGSDESRLWTWEQLRRHGIEYYRCKTSKI